MSLLAIHSIYFFRNVLISLESSLFLLHFEISESESSAEASTVADSFNDFRITSFSRSVMLEPTMALHSNTPLDNKERSWLAKTDSSASISFSLISLNVESLSSSLLASSSNKSRFEFEFPLKCSLGCVVSRFKLRGMRGFFLSMQLSVGVSSWHSFSVLSECSKLRNDELHCSVSKLRGVLKFRWLRNWTKFCSKIFPQKMDHTGSFNQRFWKQVPQFGKKCLPKALRF